MSLKDTFKKIRDDYVIRQAHSVELPEFMSGTVRRYRVKFSGRVQKVGFRLEMGKWLEKAKKNRASFPDSCPEQPMM